MPPPSPQPQLPPAEALEGAGAAAEEATEGEEEEVEDEAAAAAEVTEGEDEAEEEDAAAAAED